MVWQGMFAPGAREIDPEREEELRLAAQARGGSDWALSALVARYQPTVVRYLVRLTGKPDRAAPLAERIFVRMGKRLRGPRGGEHLRLWLLRAATEAGLDTLRHPNRPAPPRLTAPDGPVGLLAEHVGENGVGRMVSGWAGRLRGGAQRKAPPTHEFAWDDQPSVGRVGTWTGVADEALSPREIVRNRMIRAVLAELAYGDAQCLALHLVAGLNQNEVALALGVTPNVARRRIVQGLQLFGRRFESAQASLGVDLDQPEAEPRAPAARLGPALEPAWRSGFGLAAGDTVPMRPPAASVPATSIAATSIAATSMPLVGPISAPLAPAAFTGPAIGIDAGRPPLVPGPVWTAPTMPLPGSSSPGLPPEAIVDADEAPAALAVDAFAEMAGAVPDDTLTDDIVADDATNATASSAADVAAPEDLEDVPDMDVPDKTDEDARAHAATLLAATTRVTVVPAPGANVVVWPEPELTSELVLNANTIVDADVAIQSQAMESSPANAVAPSPPGTRPATRAAAPEAPRLPLAIVIADVEAPWQTAGGPEIDLDWEPVALAVAADPVPAGGEPAHTRPETATPADTAAEIASAEQSVLPEAGKNAETVTPALPAADAALARGQEDGGAPGRTSGEHGDETDGHDPGGHDSDGHDPDGEVFLLLLEGEPDEPRTDGAGVDAGPGAPGDLALVWADDQAGPATGEMDVEPEPRAER